MSPNIPTSRKLTFLHEIKKLFIEDKNTRTTSIITVYFPSYISYSKIHIIGIDISQAVNLLKALEIRGIIKKIKTENDGFEIAIWNRADESFETVEKDWTIIDTRSRRLINLENNILTYNNTPWEVSPQQKDILEAVFFLANENGFSNKVITYKDIINRVKVISKKDITQKEITTTVNPGKSSKFTRGIFKNNPKHSSHQNKSIFTLERGKGLHFFNPEI